MDVESLKKFLCSNLAIVTTVDELCNNEIVLITPAGIIRADFPNYLEKDNVGTLAKLNQAIYKNYCETYGFESEKVIAGNDGYLMLKNARITIGTTTDNFTELTVFYDQIIGIALNGKI